MGRDRRNVTAGRDDHIDPLLDEIRSQCSQQGVIIVRPPILRCEGQLDAEAQL
jgi:hypothetical protein